MGRRPSPTDMAHRGSASRPRAGFFCTLLAILLAGAAVPAGAQTLSERLTQKSQPTPGKTPDRMLVNADQLNYDRDKNTVTASGNVQIYYQGRILQADRVIYDRTADRVYAEGHSKLTDQDGTVAYADRFDLTDDFKNGFIESLRVDTADKTHFTAPRAERSGGETTVFEDGTYTACQSCKEHPDRPPLWQMRAKRIIHKNDEQMVYYEDADFEFLGIPIAYIPYLSAPDPSVKQKSGVLAPHYVTKTGLGVGVGIPIYWALAPDYDLTVTPTFLTRQGVLGTAEWRQKFLNGSYNILASGIFEQDPDAFSQPPYGAGNKPDRGSIQSTGQFLINDKWKFGWDVTVMSDKWFLTDYDLTNQSSLSSNFFKESASTVYLTGQAGRGYFDLRGYYFQGLSQTDLQSQQPVVAPVLDYHRTFDIRPQDSYGIGGQVELDANLTHLAQDLASFQSTTGLQLDNAFSLYNVCTPQSPKGTPNPTGLYYPNNCVLQGIGGDYTRATINASWQRKFIDPIGEVWNPFVFAHLSGENLDLDTSQTATFTSTTGTSTISNASQSNFIAQGSGTTGEAIPGSGLDYRYPFIATIGGLSQVFEPIVQVIARPDEPVNSATVNEDAQSLVFDDTTLFEWNKFSGDDRFEGGTRTNYGGQYTATFSNGGYINFLAGQSYQLAGRNSYATADADAVGLESGLDTRLSDTVARLAVSPSSMFSFIAKGRFDSQDFDMRRLDLMGNIDWGALETGLQYADYQAQPLIGYTVRREGLSATSKYKIDANYFVNGNVIFDMSRHYYDAELGGNAPVFFVAGLGLGAGYTDDCTTFSVNYTSAYQANQNGVGPPVRNQTILVQLELRTLGDTKVSSSLGNVKVQDGLTGAQ
jgi:LPS-assembly protein